VLRTVCTVSRAPAVDNVAALVGIGPKDEAGRHDIPLRSVRRSWRAGRTPSRRCGQRSAAPPWRNRWSPHSFRCPILWLYVRSRTTSDSRSSGIQMTEKRSVKTIVEKEQAPPTPAEQATVDRFLKRREGRLPPPHLTAKSKPNEPVAIGQSTAADILGMMLAFGTTEPGVANLLLNGLINAACEGSSAKPPSEEEINRALAAVHGIGAKDEVEAMLAVQMVATQGAAVRALRLLKNSETVPQQDSNGNLAVKLMRTFTAQVEALQRNRGKGQQKVTVEHVHVHSGGQAVVGVVENSGRGSQRKSEDQCDAKQIAHAPQATMRSADTERQPLSVTSCRCRMHGGSSPGAPRGNKNALKHAHYTAEAIAQRREISHLLRAMRAHLPSTSNR
jgi:hypothetical protein